MAADLPSAVGTARAAADAAADAVVLLSPAAPSHNAYRSFEERGDHFRVLAEA
jgi:UDP-N-acetylmuramoylalanine--D-glutamate ligase